jgi:hypothetical protein
MDKTLVKKVSGDGNCLFRILTVFTENSEIQHAAMLPKYIPPLPQYDFMAWCLLKHRDNFTFTFILQVVYICTTINMESIIR